MPNAAKFRVNVEFLQLSSKFSGLQIRQSLCTSVVDIRYVSCQHEGV